VSPEAEDCTVSDRLSVELHGHHGIAEALAAGSSGLQDSASEAAQEATAAVQSAAKVALLTARRLERQRSRARYFFTWLAENVHAAGVALDGIYLSIEYPSRC